MPLVIWLPVNAPPDAPPETAAVQAVALAEVHFAVTASPRLMVAEADGCEKLTVGAARWARAHWAREWLNPRRIRRRCRLRRILPAH